jgi:hypothetical protein
MVWHPQSTNQKLTPQDVQPVFVVSGGADQEIVQACGMVMASANVAIASMASSMASAGVQSWDAPAPTMTMALGGPNREEHDWAECVGRGIEAAPPAPWGNGLPPKVVITAGRPGYDARVCQQGAGLLTSALYQWFGQVSQSRGRRFDNHRPTMTFAGADCATRFNGNADNIPGFQIYKTRGPGLIPRPARPTGAPLNPLNPLNALNPLNGPPRQPPRPLVTVAPRPPPITITQRPFTYTQVPAPATVTLPQPPPVIVTPRPYTQVAAPATVTVTPRPYTTVAPRPVVTITLPAGQAPAPQGYDPRGPPPGWSQMAQGQQQGPPRGGAGWGPPPYAGPAPYQGQPGGYNGAAPWRGQGRQ